MCVVPESVHVHYIIVFSSLYIHIYMRIFIHMPGMLTASLVRYGVSLLSWFYITLYAGIVRSCKLSSTRAPNFKALLCVLL